MELQNYKLLQDYALEEEKLRQREDRNRSMINILKRECEKTGGKTRPKTSPEKLLKKKSLQKEFTFKLPEKSKKSSSEDTQESFRYGWKVTSKSHIPEKVKELNQRRSKMLLLGNYYSMINKTTSETKLSSQRFQKQQSMTEMKHEMLSKAKELGNRNSHAWIQRRQLAANVITAEEVNRYESLMTEIQEAELHYRKCLQSRTKPSQSFSENFEKLKIEVARLKSAKTKPRQRDVNGTKTYPILNLNRAPREDKLISETKIPYTRVQAELSQEDAMNVYDAIDIGTVLKASSSVECQVREDDDGGDEMSMEERSSKADSDDRSNYESSLSSNGSMKTAVDTLSQISPIRSVSQHRSMITEANKSRRSLFGDKDDKDQAASFHELETTFVESVQSPRNCQSVPSKTPKSFVAKLKEMLNGSKRSSFIDDVSTESLDPLLASTALEPEISSEKRDDSAHNGNSQISSNRESQMSHKSHKEAPSCMDCHPSNTSHASLHRTSTFMSSNDIFMRTLEARRKRTNPEETDAVEGEASGAALRDRSDSDTNEVVKQVYNFGDE